MPNIQPSTASEPVPAPLPPRERLKASFAAVENARVVFQKAQGLAFKAAKLHETARATFQKLQSTEHDIRQWKLQAFKSDSTEPMPPDLLEARREALNGAEELQPCGRARQSDERRAGIC